MAKVLDMAHFAQITDWKKVQADGVICKATQGSTFVDPTFVDKINGALADGLAIGGYHFFDPRIDPIAQADNFGNTCLSIKTPMILDLDIEELPLPGGGDAWDAFSFDQRNQMISDFLFRLQAHFKGVPMIYMSQEFSGSYFPNFDLSLYPLHVPDYNPSHTVPITPACWNGKWTFWQKTAKDTEAGMIGYADLDVFMGDPEGLKALYCTPS